MKGLNRKEQLKSVAGRLFRKRGYKATSMRDIAAEMGIEAPSLYNHIRGKQQILAELLIDVAQQFTAGMKEIKCAPISAQEKLQRLIADYVSITVQHTDSVSLLTGEWVHLEGKESTQFLKLRDGYEQEFRNILAQALDDGNLKEVDVDLTLYSILSTLRWLYSWYSKNDEVNKVHLEKQMIRLLLPK